MPTTSPSSLRRYAGVTPVGNGAPLLANGGARGAPAARAASSARSARLRQQRVPMFCTCGWVSGGYAQHASAHRCLQPGDFRRRRRAAGPGGSRGSATAPGAQRPRSPPAKSRTRPQVLGVSAGCGACRLGFGAHSLVGWVADAATHVFEASGAERFASNHGGSIIQDARVRAGAVTAQRAAAAAVDARAAGRRQSSARAVEARHLGFLPSRWMWCSAIRI